MMSSFEKDSIIFSSTIPPMIFESCDIAIIIPAFRAEREIETVLDGLPPYVKHIIVVDDASADATADLILARTKTDSRLMLVRHSQNQGVGSAMVSGFRKAIELGAKIAVK